MGKRFCMTCGVELPDMAQNCPICGAVVGKRKVETQEERQYREFKEQQEYFFQQQKEQMEKLQRQNEELQRQMQQMNQKKKKGVNALALVAAVFLVVGLMLPFMRVKGENYDRDRSLAMGFSVPSSISITEGTLFQWINTFGSTPKQHAYNYLETALTGKESSEINLQTTAVGIVFFALIIILVVDSFKPLKIMKGIFSIVIIALIILAYFLISNTGDEHYEVSMTCSVGFYTMIGSAVAALFSYLTYPKENNNM
ncbi:hypothetical protein SAMN04487934_11025 [Eubacterium ruminantium]|nr:hypothetical protein SAMN04487934_11025 [Eubacterium ruminantium]